MVVDFFSGSTTLKELILEESKLYTLKCSINGFYDIFKSIIIFQLQLVLQMRGGPVNTSRKLQSVDPEIAHMEQMEQMDECLKEVEEFMEVNREEIIRTMVSCLEYQ